MNQPLRNERLFRQASRADAGSANNGKAGFPAATANPAAQAYTSDYTSDGILSRKDLIGLYHALEGALPQAQCRIVQFASCYRGEGATKIASELAALVASMMGQRVLMIDSHPGAAGAGERIREHLGTLAEAASGQIPFEQAVSPASGNGLAFDYSHLSAAAGGLDTLPRLEKLKEALHQLRDRYDMIVLHACDILTDPVGLSLCRLADGVVLVLEAERTRAPAARQAVRLIAEKGASVIGIAFNKRRFYIPRWLYRWF